MIGRILWIALASYFAYKVLFDLIIPVVGTTRKVRKAFQQAREHQEAQSRTTGGPDPGQHHAPKPDAGDYIEFEEIH